MPKRGLIVTGLLGAGKTTLVRKISAHFNATVPITTTTRTVTPDDLGLNQLSRSAFIDSVRQGTLFMPIISGSELYGWTDQALGVMRCHPRVVLSARPYTALVIQALIPDLCALWLDLPDVIREQRIDRRSSGRDSGAQRVLRTAFDSADAEYKVLFARSCDARDAFIDDFGVYFE